MTNDIDARVHEQIATRNARAAVALAKDIKAVFEIRIENLERGLNTLAAQYVQLECKYNLLLTERFDGGATTE